MGAPLRGLALAFTLVFSSLIAAALADSALAPAPLEGFSVAFISDGNDDGVFSDEELQQQAAAAHPLTEEGYSSKAKFKVVITSKGGSLDWTISAIESFLFGESTSLESVPGKPPCDSLIGKRIPRKQSRGDGSGDDGAICFFQAQITAPIPESAGEVFTISDTITVVARSTSDDEFLRLVETDDTSISICAESCPEDPRSASAPPQREFREIEVPMSAARFYGFHGQSFDFNGAPGHTYSIIEDRSITLRAQFASAFTSMIRIGSNIHLTQPIVSQSTWISAIGLSIFDVREGHLHQFLIATAKDRKDTQRCSRVQPSCFGIGSVKVNGIPLDNIATVRTSSTVSISLERSNTFGRVIINSEDIDLEVDIVLPQADWNITPADESKYSHINFHIRRIQLTPEADGIVGRTISEDAQSLSEKELERLYFRKKIITYNGSGDDDGDDAEGNAEGGIESIPK